MKRKLKLNRETVRLLGAPDLDAARGGMATTGTFNPSDRITCHTCVSCVVSCAGTCTPSCFTVC
jgi:hypothetical protein